MVSSIILILIFYFIIKQNIAKNNVLKKLTRCSKADMSGKEAAKQMLDDTLGENDYSILSSKDNFYHLTYKEIHLSQGVFFKKTICSVCIGCHEAAHYIQDHTNYEILKIKEFLCKKISYFSIFVFFLISSLVLPFQVAISTTIFILFLLWAINDILLLIIEYHAWLLSFEYIYKNNIFNSDQFKKADILRKECLSIYRNKAKISCFFLLLFLII